ncbi:MAG: hypothetical protein AB1716_09690 [Planctomycetota bacterium]
MNEPQSDPRPAEPPGASGGARRPVATSEPNGADPSEKPGVMSAAESENPPLPRPDAARLAEWERLLALDRATENEVLPPEVVASPSHIRRGGTQRITWWRPGWRDTWRYVGWRWILLAPMLLLFAILLFPLRVYNAVFFVLWLKLLLLPMLGVAAWLMAHVVRRAVRARTEPFCIFCGYNLSGLPDDYRCPECGHAYSWRVIAEYRRDPRWFIERYKAAAQLPPADTPFAAGPRRRRARDGT